MPKRDVVLANNEIYHLVNKGITLQNVFISKRNLQRAVDTLFYYQNINIPCKYSKFIVQSTENRNGLIKEMRQKKEFLVEIISYCLMPNHFHFLVKQVEDKGITKFVSNFTNSYTRYFNTINDRHGPLFQGNFRAKRIENDEQLLHVSRYIHLNPFSSYLVKNFNELKKYEYSSFPEYLKTTKVDKCQKEIVLGQFKNHKKYIDFVFDRADYQQTLENIKRLLSE